jgi:hypothetical protein
MGFQSYPWSTGQATMTAAISQIVPANPARSGISIINTSTTAVYLCENANGSTSTGHYLAGVVGASFSFATTGAIYGVTAGGSALVTWAQTQ